MQHYSLNYLKTIKLAVRLCYTNVSFIAFSAFREYGERKGTLETHNQENNTPLKYRKSIISRKRYKEENTNDVIKRRIFD
jgi:hypothetical protein